MNGMSAAPNGTSLNGVPHAGHEHEHNGNSDTQILRALEIVHDPRSTNENRQDASRYLEQVRSQDEAPYHGYVLASNGSFPPIVRHYGLSLLEYVIRHRWTDYSGEQSIAVRQWIVKLAQSVEQDDPLFIRNKIAQLWVEVAKRSWGLDWMDMDELLVKLWEDSMVRKELVLEILETLSENSFGKEDTTTALRGSELNKACVEIFTPTQVMVDHFPRRDTAINVRYGDQGWVSRMAELLGWCNGDGQSDAWSQACAVKVLVALRSIVSWVILPALATTHSVQRMCESLTSPIHAIQLAAVEALYALYYRPTFSDADIMDLVWPMYSTETVDVLKRVYEWSVVEADDLHDEKYLLCKKFSEMVHNIGRFLEEKPSLLPESADLPNFLDLLLKIVRNDSLNVSIPILHLWVQLLNSRKIGSSPAVMNLIGPLLELCSQRLIRYEALPEDSNLPAILFLNEDFDTMPERHAFLGNYSRFCKDIVDSIVQKQPFDALHHILGQTDHLLQHLYDGQPTFDARNWAKYSIPALKLDAQCSVIEAALIGYGRWRASQKAKEKQGVPVDEQHIAIGSHLEQWCLILLQARYEDPAIQQRLVQLATEFATGPLKRNESVVIRVFQYVLNTKIRLATTTTQSYNPGYINAVKEFQRLCSHQLQKLALRTSDPLMTVYEDTERAISQYCQVPDVDQEDCDRCLSILFIITQRTTSLDTMQRLARLEAFVQPMMEKWQHPGLAQSLETFDGFCDLLGIANLQDYFISRNVHTIGDWSACPLDDEGKALKVRIEAAQQNLPLRTTKTFLSVSIEKNEAGSAHHEVACALWSKCLPAILPNVLQFVSLAHSFSDPSHWMNLPPESKGIPARILKDRFWQVGISTGSRDDFYNRVEESKTTLEGLASAIRGALRFVRDTSYRLLCSMSFLGDVLYKYDELPEPLAKALFAGAGALSTHQTGIILDMIRPIIEHCPPRARNHFLSPIVTAMFTHLEQKVGMEWEKIEERNKAASPDDDLLEEMKDESILRQLTFNCVSLVARLLDPTQSEAHTAFIQSMGKLTVLDPAHSSGPDQSSLEPQPQPLLRDFVLENPEVFKAVILFCTHALRMHDNRACGVITRVLRSIIHVFGANTPVAADIREFISTEVLKACITSLHDQYFVDTQSELAQLIAIIVNGYKEQTETPRHILLSLPDMTEDRVDSARYRLHKAEGNGRQQRAIVLKLLEGLRGISVSEQGKLPRPDPKKVRSAMEERYMTDAVEINAPKDESPDLGGVADMFQ